METLPTQQAAEKPSEGTLSSAAFNARTAAGGIAAALILLAGIVFAFEYAKTPPAPASQAAAAADASDPFAGISLLAKAAIVVDIQTGKMLFALNPAAQLPLASLTKVAMVLAVSEALPRDAVITIPYDTAPSGSAERLAKGQAWNVGDIINFTLVASSNDGADILAAAADSEIHARYPQSPEKSATVWRMNDLAKSLGLSNSYFLNPSGLDLSATQSGAYGSARDMAALFAYAASAQPALFSGTTQNGVILTSADGKSSTSALNTNEVQGAFSGLIMGKTGYTDLAGGNLAIVFDVGLAHPVVAVVLGSTRDGRFDDMQKLVVAARKAVAGE